MATTAPANPRTASDHSVAGLVRDLLSQGRSVRMEVTGASMSPCIRSGDIVTLGPPQPSGVRLGDVIAVSPHPGRLVVHRLVARTADELLTWGDAVVASDEPLVPGAVLGVVRRVERAGRPVRFGLGPERLLIVWAQRWGVLPPLRAGARALAATVGVSWLRAGVGTACRGAE